MVGRMLWTTEKMESVPGEILEKELKEKCDISWKDAVHSVHEKKFQSDKMSLHHLLYTS